MAEQNPSLPPLPLIENGGGPADSHTTSVWLEQGVDVGLDIQVEEDGSYRTSTLRIGRALACVDIFAKRDQIERLHRLLGQHLEQLDEYEAALYAMRLDRDGIAADVPDDVMRAALDAARRAAPAEDEVEIDAWMAEHLAGTGPEAQS